MPYRTVWVNPRKFCTVNGVPVFCTYKEDNADHKLLYWYTLDGTSEDDTHKRFDIRELTAFKRAGDPWNHRAILRQAFKTGELP